MEPATGVRWPIKGTSEAQRSPATRIHILVFTILLLSAQRNHTAGLGFLMVACHEAIRRLVICVILPNPERFSSRLRVGSKRCSRQVRRVVQVGARRVVPGKAHVTRGGDIV